MTNKTKTERIPVYLTELVKQLADDKKWSKVTAYTEVLKSSALLSKYLTLAEKNREIA